MNKMTKLGLAAMIAAGSMTAMADEDQLRKELADAQAEITLLKNQLARQEGNVVAALEQAEHAITHNLPAGIYMPGNLINVKVDRDDDEVEVKGELESADIKALAREAQKVLQENGYIVVKESIDKDDEAKLSYEKVTGNVRETIEVEIDKSWLSDKVDYEVEYERHD